VSRALAAALRAQGGQLAELVSEDGSNGPSAPARLGASGPRTAGDRTEYELLLEMILEGSRLHYGGGRVVRTDDRDLALLLGDQLYALGLSRLAALGDLDATAELSDVISLVAQIHAGGGDPELVDAVWEAGAAAVGWGSDEELRDAKARARCGDPSAADALRVSAARRATS
jgi:hypothetical protein